MNAENLHGMALNICREIRELKLDYEDFEHIIKASSSFLHHCDEAQEKVLPKNQYNHLIMALGCLRECQAVLSFNEIDKHDLLQLMAFAESKLYNLIQETKGKPARDGSI